MKINVRFSAITSLFVLCPLIVTLIWLAGCTKEGTTGPAGPPGDSQSDNLMDPSIMPEVVSSTPANNAVGPFQLYAPGLQNYFPHLIVQFNKLIDPYLLPMGTIRVSGFSRPVYVQPFPYYIYRNDKSRQRQKAGSGPYDFIIAYTFYDSTTGTRANYEVGKTYTVTVDTTLFDINNNHPTQRKTFSYTPEPYFRVVSFSPSNGATNVYRLVQPYLYFNAHINGATLNHLHSAPPITGTWEIASYDSLAASLSISNPLALHSSYSISVDQSATDAAGNLIGGTLSASFTTASFGIVYSYPPNGSTMIDPPTQIEIDYTDAVDTASARAAFSISPATPGQFYSYPNYCYFYPTQQFTPSTQYTVTLSTSLKTADGFHLESPYNLRFTTAPFRITSTTPFNQEAGVIRSTSCYIYCNLPVDTGSIRGAFHISPATLGTFQGNPQSSEFIFIPSTQLAASTLYTITIDTTLRSSSGYTMAAPYTFSFTTGTY